MKNFEIELVGTIKTNIKKKLEPPIILLETVHIWMFLFILIKLHTCKTNNLIKFKNICTKFILYLNYA